ncbi:MAG: glycine cleavage system aminomethyltransferase GcvT [Candidatus Kapaibacterium sp.]
MKKTAFNDIHKKLGAKMVSFAGYDMPIQYPKGIIHEHKVVREKVGVFDVTHMGEFEVRGPQALEFVQKISVNDASKLEFGNVQYSAMCYEDGGIVDDMLVYNMGEYFMLVVNASNIDKDWEWCMKNAEGMDVQLLNVSDNINLLAVQGPKSRDTLQKLTEENLSGIEFYNFKMGKLAGVDMILSRTGYTGELGFELYFRGDKETAEKVWEELFKAGEEYGIEPVGLGSRDTLRLEKGYCLYGNDIDKDTNTIEAGLGWITKLKKGEFNGKEVLEKTKEEKPSRRLVGFKVLAERLIPRKGYKIFSGGNQIGVVTSGTQSPSLGIPIGMGYVEWDKREPGTKIQIEARGKLFEAEVVKFPFV